MSQPVSERQTLLDPAEPSESTVDLQFDLTTAVTADAMADNADRLMDSLFDEVDQMLERGVLLPIEPVAPTVEASPAPTPVIPLEAILPPRIGPRDLIPQPLEAEEPPEAAEVPLETPAAELEKKNSWNPLWLAVLISSLLMSAGILSFLFRDQLLTFWLTALGRSTPAPATVAASGESEPPKDADFLQYIQRSLDRLAKQSPSPSPTVAVSPSPSPSVVERVYVPIYPTAPSPVAISPASPASPAAPAANPNSSRPGSTAPTRTNPAPVAAPTASSPVPNIAAASHTLVGVLELGDRSAALFEVNGTPQRIEIGEAIGTSGWTLVSIKNQEAIVRRNGEVRSIYVGQKF